jgi:predicted DNA-binding transcriptional regulator YafY
MSAKLQRWIDLVAALLRRRYPVLFEELIHEVPAYASAGQAAEARRRMFERDKKELRSFGIPIETRDVGDGELGYQLDAAHFYLPYLSLLKDGRRTEPARVDRYGYRSLPSLCFEPDELAAVVRAARMVGALGLVALREDAASALRKLGRDLPLDGVEQEDGVHLADRGERIVAEHFTTFGAALAAGKRVSMQYHGMSRDTVEARVVEPLGLFFLGHHWYLAAREVDDRLVKNFRLSRVRAATMNAQHPGSRDFEPPADFVLSEHARARQPWELGNGDVTEVVVAVSAGTGAALEAERLGAAVEGAPDRRRFQVRRLDAFVRWVLGSGGAVVPVEPPEAVALFRHLLDRTLAVYGARHG